MKLKWKVGDAPTGLYCSFFDRSWPVGFFRDEVYVHVTCRVGYTPARARGEDLRGECIKVRVRVPAQAGLWELRTLKATFSDLASAKAAAQSFFDRHPEYQPQGE